MTDLVEAHVMLLAALKGTDLMYYNVGDGSNPNPNPYPYPNPNPNPTTTRWVTAAPTLCSRSLRWSRRSQARR